MTGAAEDPASPTAGIEALMSQSLANVALPRTRPAQELSDARFMEVITSVIQDLAQAGNVVIIGRGSQVILKDLPHALHVYVVATREARLRSIMQRQELSREAAEKMVRDTDLGGTAYHKKFFQMMRQYAG